MVGHQRRGINKLGEAAPSGGHVRIFTITRGLPWWHRLLVAFLDGDALGGENIYLYDLPSGDKEVGGKGAG